MAWSLLRGTILRCFRSQILILDGRGSSLRSLSSDSGLVDKKIISSDQFANSLKSLSSGLADKKIISSDQFANSLKSLSSDSGLVDKTIISSDPFANSLKSGLSDSRLVPVDNNAISSIPSADFLKSLSSDCGRVVDYESIISSDPFANVELIPDDNFRAAESVETGSSTLLIASDSDYVYTGADMTEAFVKHAIRCEELSGIVYKAIKVVSNHSIFEICSADTKVKILSTVFDRIQNYSQLESYEVFLMKIFLRSMYNDDKNEITKDEVISRVLDVIQSYPEVCHHKVTEETHNGDDLELQPHDYHLLQKALYLEFRLYVPCEEITATCKQLSDHIYDKRMERMDFEKFREYNMTGYIFWPEPLLCYDYGVC